jgi:hypothetical protein
MFIITEGMGKISDMDWLAIKMLGWRGGESSKWKQG